MLANLQMDVPEVSVFNLSTVLQRVYIFKLTCQLKTTPTAAESGNSN